MSTTATSRQLAHELAFGEHVLYNERLRDIYGLSRITAKGRQTIAAELRRSGLDVLSDPSREPLVVRKPAPRVAAVARAGQVPWWRRRWAVALGVVVLLCMLAAATSDSDNATAPVGGQPATAASASAPTTQAQPAEPVETLADAARAVEDQHYAAAMAIGAALGDDDRDRVGRAVSRHVAKRIRAALRRADRAQARRLLAQARKYPATASIRSARASYRAAQARAAYRAGQRRIARQAARRAAADRRAAERAAEAAAAAAAPSVENYEAPQTSGPSTTNWCGKRDGDGDGIYCE